MIPKSAELSERLAAKVTNRAVRRIRSRYVRVVKMDDKWTTYLQIDHQGFAIVEQTSKRRAMWFGNMLAVALYRLIESNTGGDARAAK